MRGMDLSLIDLRYTDLSYADLSYTDLTGSDLSYTDLTGSDLTKANLSRINLGYTNLTLQQLQSANTEEIKADLFKILNCAVNEVQALRSALVESRIDGFMYEGPCCCLIGTIAKAKGVPFDMMPGLLPDLSRPAERWFMAIRPNKITPITLLTLQWIDEFLESKK